MTNEEKIKMLEELEKAYYSGVQEIEYSGKKIKYQSSTEMKGKIDLLKKELGLIYKNSSRILTTHSKGL